MYHASLYMIYIITYWFFHHLKGPKKSVPNPFDMCVCVLQINTAHLPWHWVTLSRWKRNGRFTMLSLEIYFGKPQTSSTGKLNHQNCKISMLNHRERFSRASHPFQVKPKWQVKQKEVGRTLWGPWDEFVFLFEGKIVHNFQGTRHKPFLVFFSGKVPCETPEHNQQKQRNLWGSRDRKRKPHGNFPAICRCQR